MRIHEHPRDIATTRPVVARSATVDIHLLGPVEVVVDDRPVRRLGPRALGVVSLLALAGDAGVSSRRLTTQIWPGGDPGRTRAALHAVVFRLRSTPLRPALATTPTGYRLAHLRRCDAHELRAAVAGARSDDPAGLERLEQVVRSWRGTPFDGLDPEALTLERDRLREEHLRAVELLVAHRLRRGGGTHLVGEVETLVRDEPLRESLVRLLMLLLERAGRPAEALAAYDRTRRHLADHLGVSPSAALEAEYLRLLRAS